jgi:hypothetical protein
MKHDSSCKYKAFGPLEPMHGNQSYVKFEQIEGFRILLPRLVHRSGRPGVENVEN